MLFNLNFNNLKIINKKIKIYYSTKSKKSKIDDDSCLKAKLLLIKEQKSLQWKNLNSNKEMQYSLIHLGNLNFDLITYKINSSNNIIKDTKKKYEYSNYKYFFLKKTKVIIEYKIMYLDFIKERNIFYILFTVLVGKVVEISIVYTFKNEFYNYYIFYEILINDFFSFIHRVLNEIKIFELYLYDKDCIIPKSIIQSINISILKKIPDKLDIKYI